MSPKKPFTRRNFWKGTLGASAIAPAIVSSTIQSTLAAPNNRITVGFVGMGKRSRSLLRQLLNQSEVQVVAVSEVSTARRQHAIDRMVNKAYADKQGSGDYQGCDGYNDFRQMLTRNDLDAVVIGTPDHWHAIPAIQAAQAKLDIYCEKPLSHTIHEGRAMVDAARQNEIVFQTGSQQRTEYGGKFRKAAELIRSGRIGKVKRVRVGVGSSPVHCDLPAQPVPTGVDWDMWVGPAPFRGYHEELCPKGVHNHFPAWRRYIEFGGGGLADMGAHHFDIAQWALGMDGSGPVRVIPPEDGDHGLKFVYANGIELFHGGPSGATFEGTEGRLHVDRGELTSEPQSIIDQPLGANEVHLEDPQGSHMENWLNCIRSREKPIADVAIGHRSATICHLANIGYRLRRELRWDPETERFVNDSEANDLLTRPKRNPWHL